MFLKTLSQDRKPCHGGGVVDYSQCGIWTPPIDPIPCKQGYHICRPATLLEWIAPRVFVVKARGTIVESRLKQTAQSICLVREIPFGSDAAMKFARRCVEAVSDGPERSIEESNADNDQYALTMALARQALTMGAEVAVQIAPKRAAQAAAWKAYKEAIDVNFRDRKGVGDSSFWESVEEQAAVAKTEAHDAERERQLTALLKTLRISESRGVSRYEEEYAIKDEMCAELQAVGYQAMTCRDKGSNYRHNWVWFPPKNYKPTSNDLFLIRAIGHDVHNKPSPLYDYEPPF